MNLLVCGNTMQAHLHTVHCASRSCVCSQPLRDLSRERFTQTSLGQPDVPLSKTRGILAQDIRVASTVACVIQEIAPVSVRVKAGAGNRLGRHPRESLWARLLHLH